MFTATIVTLAFASFSLALPNERRASACDVSGASIAFPPQQTSIPLPNVTASYIGLGVGIQNYTCNSGGTYTNTGAVAEIFDISCLYGTQVYKTIQDFGYAIWKNAPAELTPQEIISVLHSTNSAKILGQHYFVPNPFTGTGALPKWDFSSEGTNRGNPNAFVIAVPTGQLASPTGPQDLTWVSLRAIQGSLAQSVYRVDARGGQPPLSCTPGSADISVRYVDKYWLFGSLL